MLKPHLFNLFTHVGRVVFLFANSLLQLLKQAGHFFFKFLPQRRALLARWRNRISLLCSVLIIVFVSVFLLVKPAQANAVEEVVRIVSSLLSPIVSFMGKLLMVLLDILQTVANFNDFINLPAIQKAWAMIRDVCNMFFIVFLMIIAFATILNIQQYHYKNTLMRLILMAVLINFSLMISGIFIDFAQVVMMTFVKGIKYVAAGNIVAALGLDAILRYHQSATPGEMNIAGTMVTLILGLILMIVTSAILLVIIMQLVMRIIFIWIYVVLSPLAYAANVIPPTRQYAQDWWRGFTNYLIQGPVVVFFLWMALYMMASYGGSMNTPFNEQSQTSAEADFILKEATAANESEAPLIGACPGEMCSKDRLLSFVIGAGMLVGAVVMSKKLAGAGGSIVGKAYGKLQQAGTKALKGAAYPVTAPTKAIGRGIAKGAKAGWAKVPLVGTEAKARREEGRERKKALKEAEKAGDKEKRDLDFWRSQSTKGGKKGEAAKKVYNQKAKDAANNFANKAEAEGWDRARMKKEAKTKEDRLGMAKLLAKQGEASPIDIQDMQDLFGDARGKPLLNSYMDDLKKYQPDMGYRDAQGNFDEQAFKKDLQAGKTTLSNLRANAFNDKQFMQVLQNTLGSTFPKRMKKIIDDGGKDYKDAIKKGLEKTFDPKSAIKTAQDVNGNTILDDTDKNTRSRSNYAAFSGDYDRAFAVKGAFNKNACAAFIQKASPEMLSTIDLKTMSADMVDAIVNNIHVNQLKNLSRADEIEHVRAFIKKINSSSNTKLQREIQEDNILKTF